MTCLLKWIRSSKPVLLGSIALLCFYFFFCLIYGERIQINGGLGWDGYVYANLTRTKLSVLFGQTLNPYYFQRIFPAIIVHISAKIFNINLYDNHKIISVFYLYNTLLLGASAYLFYRVGEYLRWSMQIQLTCLSLLLINFATLKTTVYYPVLTDTNAFFLGVLTLYFYLKKNQYALLIIMLIGAFVFPSIIFITAPLLFFPRSMKPVIIKHQTNTTVPIAICLILGLWVLYWSLQPPLRVDGALIKPLLLPLSLTALLLYLFFAIRFLIYPKVILRSIKAQFSWKGSLYYVLLFVILQFLISFFSKQEPPVLTLLQYITWISYTAVANPLTSLVSHFMYFGPGVLLILILWPNVSKICYELGIGCVAFIFLYIVLSFGSESRQVINAWPFFVMLIGSVLNKYSISWQFSFLVACIGLFLSRCWLKLNVGAWDNHFLEFPTQMYFMNFGPWMSTPIYIIFALLGLTFLLIFHYMLTLEMGLKLGNKGKIA